MKLPWLALTALAGAILLPGCFDSDLDVVATNQTAKPVTVDAWINHTKEGHWHRSALVGPGETVVLGHFGGGPQNDYLMEARAGSLHASEPDRQLGEPYHDWRIDVFEDRIETSQNVV